MRPLGRINTGIGFLLLCLALGANALYDASFSDMEQVKDVDRELKNFMFDCIEHPWINPCFADFGRKYLMLFNDKGNYLKETLNRTDETQSFLSASLRKKTRKPADHEIMGGKGYPRYLFQLEGEDYGSGTFYIAASSGKLLVAGNENMEPSLLLKEDHCTIVPTLTPSKNISTTTVSPITSLSPINSTMAPTADYDCKDQALWTLWKRDERFLVIQSVHQEGFFIFIAVGNRKVTLNGGVPTMMTGIKSSFLSDRGAHTDGKYITLERTAGEAEPGIGREDYGDVVVHYFDRDGSEHHGYICDYGWGREDAISVCKHLGYTDGMPTYDGRYSITRTPDYVISGLSCDQESFETCTFRTICGTSDPSCLVQISMKQFKGKGYACNEGSTTDVAGVICGNQTQITNILKEAITCDRATIQKDNKSVAKMFGIQKQIEKVGSKMFENKHWSEYLLPMPMAVSLMSTLLLVSSQFDRDVKLLRPASGKWDHLKYDYLQPNLLFLSHNVKNNFMLSNANMGVIKVNSRTIHDNLKKCVSFAFSTDEFESKTLLKRSLRYISEDAQTNKEKAEEVSGAFKETGKIIGEFLEALKNSDANQGNIKGELENALTMVKDENEKDEKMLKEEKKKKEKYDVKVEKSRKDFFAAAKSAMNSMCVDEVTECNTCQFKPRQKTEQCHKGKLIQECVQYKEMCLDEGEICLEEEVYCSSQQTFCAGGYEEQCLRYGTGCLSEYFWGECSKTGSVCKDWGPKCRREEKRCQTSTTRCKTRAKKCIKYENKCIKFEPVCTDPIYYPDISGNYCQDDGRKDKLCSKCKWIDEVQKSLKNVADMQMQIQVNILQNGGSYSGITSIAEDLVQQMNRFTQDVQNYKLWEESKKKSHIAFDDVKAFDNSNGTTAVFGDVVTAPTISNETRIEMADGNETRIEMADGNNTKSEKLEAKAKKNIIPELKLMKLMFEMNIDLLSENKIVIGKKLREYLLKLVAFTNDLIERKIGTVHQMTNIEKNKVTSLLTMGKAIHQEAKELQEKMEISFKKGAKTADHKTGEHAGVLMESLANRHKTEKNIESLTNKMSNSIREILAKEIQTQDVQATIEYLRECFKHLNFLQVQWDTLRSFFQKLVDFLTLMKKDINRMKDYYKDLGVILPKKSLGKAFKEDLQTKIVESLADNIYVKRIAFFYTKIAEDGILDKMSQIGSNLQKIDNPEVMARYKKYIQDEALMTQDRIKKYVSKEEAKLNDQITKEVSSIKNVLACKLEERENMSLTLRSIDNLLSKENDEKNVNVTTSTATEEELDNMDILKEVEGDLNKLVDDENEDGLTFEDEDEDYDYFD